MGAKTLSKFSLSNIQENIRKIFSSHDDIKQNIEEMKEQVEDHLTSINENTNEIQANYEHSLEVEEKINKIAERIDEITMILSLHKDPKTKEMPKLTTVEKEVFLALYKICDEKDQTTYKEIAEMINLSDTLVMNYITILIEKGIPIIKSYAGTRTKLKLSTYFKNLQTKKDILKINDDISEQIVLNKYI
jgi:predicted transcriptional regulator|tara:strand:+ start:2159 stop:2728 length:570 start_codon:yes stop_codon:yes gene_type:complete